MKTRQKVVIFGLCAVIAAGILALVLTRNSPVPVQTTTRRAPLVNEQLIQTARRLAALASTREEQRFAQQALRIADHAVDLAFSETMREAALQQATNTEAKGLFARVSRAEAQVKSDQEVIDSVKKEASKSGQGSGDEIQKQLDLLQAQLELDKDDLDDARLALLRSGADPLSRVQRQFARYQTAQQQNDASRTQGNLPDAEASSGSHLLAQFSAWRIQRDKAVQLQQARDEALQEHDKLQQKRETLEQNPTTQSGSTQAEQAPSAAGQSQDDMVIAMLRRLSERHKNAADLSRRIQDHQDLADVYGNWIVFVQAQKRTSVHGIVRAVVLILVIVLGVYLADLAIDRFLTGLIPDRRRMRTLQVIARFVVQAVGVLLAILVLVGVPNQMPTILGLAGAGLTVALKDFIVAFFGWFALMGRNGIRVGDWVEIQGVVGEVAEISLLRTVLLETGNWNDAGHPTGRKVAFINSYAIEGHYFNFSTSGQWLWDELQILVPSSQNPYPILESIQQLVVAGTEENVHKAEDEWQRAPHRDRIGAVSAAPAINLRPTTSGVEIHVRYITRAQERYATRTKLYQDIVALLHQKQPEAVGTPHAS